MAKEVPVPGAFGFPLGFAVTIVVTAVTIAGGATGHHGWAVLATAASVAAMSAVTTPHAAMGTAVVAWCLYDGFILGRQGDLVLTGASGRAAAALTMAAFAGAAIGVLVRHTRRPAVRIPAPRAAPDATTRGHSFHE